MVLKHLVLWKSPNTRAPAVVCNAGLESWEKLENAKTLVEELLLCFLALCSASLHSPNFPNQSMERRKEKKMDFYISLRDVWSKRWHIKYWNRTWSSEGLLFLLLTFGQIGNIFWAQKICNFHSVKKKPSNTDCEFHLKNNEMMGKEKSFNFYGKEKNICLILLMLAHTHHFSISHRRRRVSPLLKNPFSFFLMSMSSLQKKTIVKILLLFMDYWLW